MSNPEESGINLEDIARTLAVAAAVKKLAAAVEAAAKAKLTKGLKRGSVYAYTASGAELGYATVPKPSREKAIITITDEAQVFAWMVEEFGPECIEQRVELTEQGRKSFEAYVLEAHAMHGEEPYFDLPGVSVTVPPTKAPTPRFTPSKDVVELVRGMAAAGELNLGAVLSLEGGES